MAFSLFVVAAAVYMLSAIPAFSSMKQSKGNFVGDLYIKLASAIPAMCDDLRELEDFLLICLVKVETEAQILVNDPPDLSELFPLIVFAKSVPKVVKDAGDAIDKGEGVPNCYPDGTQKVYQGRENKKWKGSLEFKVPGRDGLNPDRILKHPNGDKGWVEKHDYNKIRKL